MKNKEFLPPIRIILLIAVTVLLGVFQNVFLAELKYPVLPLIPLTVSIAVREKELTSLLFGALAGAILDLVSSVHDGVFALTFAVMAGLISLLARYKVRDTLMSAVLMTLFFSTIVCGVFLVFNYFRVGGTPESTLRVVFPVMLIATVLTPVFYYPIRFVESKLRASE
ncbi:MAG: hypothetical protein IK104_12110 [Clostridia bacterium]|nr:hypothetical protein [Clostridia bacterium]